MSKLTFQFMSPLAGLILVLVLYLQCTFVFLDTKGIFPEIFMLSVS
jgi:hypothetical protein